MSRWIHDFDRLALAIKRDLDLCREILHGPEAHYLAFEFLRAVLMHKRKELLDWSNL